MVTAPARWLPELLEREQELERLDQVLAEARHGEGRLVLIEAPAGMGKTRLVERVRSRASRAGMRVLSARATELEQAFPYGVVRQLFEPLLAEVDEEERTALLDGPAAAAAPALGIGARRASKARKRPAAVEPSPGPLGDLSFTTLHGLYWLTAHAVQAGTLLLAVDDAHWADAPSLQFLEFLAPRLEGLAVCLVVASRPPDDETGRLARLGADAAAERMNPGPLGRASSARLLAQVLQSPPDEAFVRACQELTGGNPFLLAELARTLATEGVEPTAAGAPAVRELVPDTIARAVLLRLAPLPAAARDLARAIAILGDGCDPRLAAALAGVPRDDAAAAADALRAADILDHDPPLAFVHPLVRNAIYAELPAGARSREHERAAAMLADEGAPPERLASHLLAVAPAADRDVCLTLQAAARAALDQGAPEPAIAYLRRALEEPAPDDLRGDLLDLLNNAGFRAADTSVTEPLEPDALAELKADPARLVRSGLPMAMGLIGSGRLEEGVDLLEHAIDAAERAGDLERAVDMDLQLIAMTQLPPAPARERFQRYAGRLAEGTPEQLLVYAAQSWWSSLVGTPARETADLARRGLSDGRIFAARPYSLPPAQAILVLARADEIEAATTAAEKAVAVGRELGSIGTLAGGWWLRGYAAYRAGDLRSAEADTRQAVDAARLHGFLHVFTIWVALLIEILIERDELDAAEKELTDTGMAGEIPDGYWSGPIMFSRARLRLAQGRMSDAADDLLELERRKERWGTVGNTGSPVGSFAALAVAGLGDRDRAVELAGNELALAREWGADSAIGEAQTVLGVITAGSEGLALLREAVDILAGAPTRLLHAKALVELGTMLRRERRPSEAREPLAAGLDLARRCGAVAVARRAADELEATGERVERHTPIGPDTLTPSERRVAEMAARGMTNREIAGSLYVTIKTVESHLRAAYDKLGISSRGELADKLPGPWR